VHKPRERTFVLQDDGARCRFGNLAARRPSGPPALNAQRREAVLYAPRAAVLKRLHGSMHGRRDGVVQQKRPGGARTPPARHQEVRPDAVLSLCTPVGVHLMAADREEHDAHMRGAAMAEHVYVESDPESEDRHILLNGRRVGKIIWDAAEEQWEIHATPDGDTSPPVPL
jgi:hypothetical protein